jgi:hypothetical protein
MRMQRIITALLAATVLTAAGTTAGFAQGAPGPDRPGFDRQNQPSQPNKPGKPGKPAAAPQQLGPARHDRYWKPEYKSGYVAHDRVFYDLRKRHYDRFDGKPYFFNGRYVVKARRGGKPVFVEINPYTGGFIGEVRF